MRIRAIVTLVVTVTLSVQVVRAIRGDQQGGQAIQGAVCVQDFPTAAAPDPRAAAVAKRSTS